MDFEKYWGVHDVKPIDQVPHFKNTSLVVNELLRLFKRYDTHVTWAFVGLLAHKNLKKLLSTTDRQPIPYLNKTYSPFPLTKDKYGDFDAALLSGKKELSTILNTPHQELASHTYSHFYCLEQGISAEDFKADCEKMNSLAVDFKTQFSSIVFPRNQVNTDYLSLCKPYGFAAYRGNQENKFWRNSTLESESFFKKTGRVLDAYLPLSKTSSYPIDQLHRKGGLANIPANRFFRPHSGKGWLEKRKVKRIKNEMLKAARNGSVYHLWWHPHNFTQRTNDSLAQIEELLAYAQVLDSKFGFESLNMSEIANRVHP